MNTTNNSISFVLVETTHAGNIGAAARAMKTMGFTSLRLVNPCEHLTAEAMVRASGADDILKGAEIYDSLSAAVADRTRVFGTSGRSRSLEWSTVELEQAAQIIAAPATNDSHQQGAAAIVFGRERSGLTNEELDVCDHRLSIPCNPDFSSLNLGSAVQVVAYELHRTLAAGNSNDSAVDSEGASAETRVDKQAMEHFFTHLEQVLVMTGFLDPEKPRYLMRRLRRLFGRAEPAREEMQILRGFLTSVEKSLAAENKANPSQKSRKPH